MRGISAAPLGLKNPAARVPRPLAWADLGLARWAGTQRKEHHDVP